MEHNTSRGDSANWLQAIVALLTLLGVVYAAIKASHAAISTEKVACRANEISEKSTIISERSYIVNILGYLAEKSNRSLLEQTLLIRKWNECQEIISSGGQPAAQRAKDIQDGIFVNISKEKNISIFVTSILKCHNIIDSCEYKNPKYFKDILFTYLDTDSIVELETEQNLQWLSKDFKSRGATSQFYKLAEALEKNYEDARNFLNLNTKK